MKINRIAVIALVFFSITLANCGGNENSEETTSTYSDTSAINEPTEELVFDVNDYSNDWNEIKGAILDAKTERIDQFMETPDATAEDVIMMCAEDWVLDELRPKTYEELTEVDYNGDLVKEFSASITEFVDGEEYGSAIFLYFKETKQGLRLTGVMAAG